MDINFDTVDPKPVFFVDLEPGDLFYWCKPPSHLSVLGVYMKTVDEGGVDVQAVNLGNGFHYWESVFQGCNCYRLRVVIPMTVALIGS